MCRLRRALAVLALLGAVSSDIIFHVPEVLVRHAAAPRPVGSGPAAPRNESEPDQQRYEYFVEHAISTSDAKKMATMLKPADIPESLPGCGKCSQRDLEYCEAKVLADHCCCERRFVRDPFPWLPHTCYIGAERCVPLAASCAHYARLRDCCCIKRLADHWKGILSRSSRLSLSGISLMLLSVVLLTAYL